MGFPRTILTIAPLPSQETTPNEKASRYHRILQKKPDNATLFNRFVESWLDTHSKESLQKWLEDSTKNGTPADYQILASFHDHLGQDQAALLSSEWIQNNLWPDLKKNSASPPPSTTSPPPPNSSKPPSNSQTLTPKKPPTSRTSKKAKPANN